MDAIFIELETALGDLATTSKSDVATVGSDLLQTFDTNVATIDTLASGEFLD